jgi:hypothetical protein
VANDIAGAIGAMLDENPFSSYKVLCRHFRIGEPTCLPIRHNKLGLTKVHLRWMPHTLSINQKND